MGSMNVEKLMLILDAFDRDAGVRLAYRKGGEDGELFVADETWLSPGREAITLYFDIEKAKPISPSGQSTENRD